MSATEDKLKELGIASPQLSIAKAIEHLSSKERIKMLSVLRKEKMVSQLEMMYDMGTRFKWGFLNEGADNRLQLFCSLKGLRAQQIVDVVKQPSEKIGVAGQLKEKISSFIKSGQ